MTHVRAWLVVALSWAAPGLAAQTAAEADTNDAAAEAEPARLTAEHVRRHLGHVIDWYHRLGGLGPNPALADDVVTRERLDQLRLTEVRLAFAFGRAAAPLVTDASAGDADAADRREEDLRYDRMLERVQQRSEELRHQIASVTAQLQRAPAAGRPVLTARKAQLEAALRLTSEVEATVQRLQQFAIRSNSRASGETGLLADITDMERTVPEARLASGATRERSEPAPPRAAASVPPPEAGGLIGLAAEWFDLREARRLHQHYIDATVELSRALEALSSMLTAEVRALLATTSASTREADAARLAEQRTAIQDATRRFRELSTLLVPLGEESITLDGAREVLEQRKSRLDQRAGSVARRLLLRGGLLVASVAVILVISSAWRGATFRYLGDSRRRRQFLTLRRVVVTVALIIVVCMAFLSDVGSLATYIGFLTAGLAVALQNVILAVVAYFFLIGRYGVRVGDRITLAGVTGRVAEIGLIRIYLTELAGPDLTPTGRMIVLSNAVIFQPQALFKQLSGIDFAWHTLSFTLDPAADFAAARARLKERADQVYDSYRDEIEKQVRVARHHVDFDFASPAPEVTTRFSEKGLEIVVRYPVLPDQTAQVDQRMSRALREALDEEPRLPLAQG